jgi:hypothetical protein
MKKVTLAFLVLALCIPALADVNISMSNGVKADYNLVTISYDCNEGEEVRAFALTISVSDGGFLVDSDDFASDPNYADYYVSPSSIGFDVNDGGETYISSFGNPIAEQDANGGILEVASLYAAADSNHPNPPASSGNLCTFRVISSDCGGDDSVQVTIGIDAQRGGVVLKDPNDTPDVVLPDALAFEYCCWLCPTQAIGNCNTDGNINVFDYFLFKKSYGTNSSDPHGTAQDEYNCCCDFNHDGNVNVFDYFTFKKYYGTTGLASCANIYCP